MDTLEGPPQGAWAAGLSRSHGPHSVLAGTAGFPGLVKHVQPKKWRWLAPPGAEVLGVTTGKAYADQCWELQRCPPSSLSAAFEKVRADPGPGWAPRARGAVRGTHRDAESEDLQEARGHSGGLPQSRPRRG